MAHALTRELLEEGQRQITDMRVAETEILSPETFSSGIARVKSLLDLSKILNVKTLNKAFDCVIRATEMNYLEDELKRGFDRAVYKSFLDHCVLRRHQFRPGQQTLLDQFVAEDYTAILKRVEQRKQQLLASIKPPEETIDVPRRIKMAETALQSRTQRLAIVLENPYDSHNQQAVLRTADCMGIQHIYIVVSKNQKRNKFAKNITKGNENFLSIHEYETTTECVFALRQRGYQIWATDLSPEAVALDHSFATNAPIPEKLAIVMGRETDGCTAEILAAADKRVYIPLYGFTESLNMSVAAAMLIQWVMLRCPESRGDIPTEEKQQIREKWLSTLAKSDSKRETYAKYANIDIEMLDDLRRSEKEAFITNKVKRKLDDQRAKATTKSAGVNAALAANDAMDTDSASTEAVGDLPESDAKRAKTNE